ncbi:hypothetical protein THRCLA_20054 [Thraustotheca clavata]|uniref:LNR domain-containing protein n=1 Tax=Thraustotheca clavata TaxID=74557 RepID=A0A1W0AC93_9STRA|nr:hypothetical protein THRCLA_20054 [Thraustotheca clavata]
MAINCNKRFKYFDRLLFVRQSVCPGQCNLSIKPLFQTGCFCAYAHIHCNSSSNLEVLQPSIFSTRLTYLEIDHCDLPNGIPDGIIAPFTSLFALRILFSNMTTYNSPNLPSTLTFLEIRYSQLQTVPNVIAATLPPQLIYLALDGNYIHDIPISTLQSWKQLNVLHLSETQIGDTTFDNIVQTLPSLNELSLHHTNITKIPPRLIEMSAVQTVFLSSNQIQGVVPVGVSGFIDLSCNPLVVLSGLPSAVTFDNSLLYCSGNQCSPRLLANNLCDVPCNLAKFGWDNGACASYNG